MKVNPEGRRGRPDFLLLILTLALVGFGLVMVFSSSSSTAAVSRTAGNDPLYYLKKQFLFAALGTVIMLVVMNFRYQVFKRGFMLFFLPVFFMLMIVPFVAREINGARSWFNVMGFAVQPTEFAKLALILYLGTLIAKKGERFRSFKKGLVPVIVIVGIVCGMIMLQPDLGSCLVIAACAFLMIVAGGANLRQLAASAFFGGIVLTAVGAVAFLISPTKWEYRISRFTSYQDPLADSLGDGYQVARSLMALGHGGFSGAGLGHGIQKVQYLPFAYNDFIFAIIGEELGFIGSTLFLIVFLLFLWRGLIVALRCPDIYGTVVGAGIVSLFAVQAFINIGGVTNAIPLTGVTLPFISYGGSSLLASLMSVGVLLSISREANRQPASAKRATDNPLRAVGRQANS
ncbi:MULTISPECIES: putative lipid II flippase FtsW [Paenibacillus]|uniref:putative lipid II flippase FtsW n=1 Tax=Paenibacillus TaxID=44249 RepID=UPI00038FC520|nr:MULTISPECIES: putative lipid II flippase FtsW [Paenibacillus]KKC46896.1 stage V sporulation protein E [Paenibacillus sp. D9]CDN43675.1 Stage V sporulation protein E [Paenibacillus sp. P22]